MYHQSFAADAEVSSQAITPALMMDVDKVNPSGYNGGNWMNRIIKECWCHAGFKKDSNGDKIL